MWVVLGSSTAAGFGASSSSQAWVARLAVAESSRGVTIINLARGGLTTYEALPVSSPAVAGRPVPDPSVNSDAAMALRPKLVLVSFPTNDTAAGFGVDEVVSNLLTIRGAVLAGGASVVMLSTQPRNLPDAQLAQLPTIDDRLAAAVGNCFVAVRAPLAGRDGHLDPRYDSGDGIHPNDAGHALIFGLVDALLQSGRCIPAPR